MKKTLIMVLLAIAMGAYVWIYEIEGEEKRKADQELESKLITVPKDSIRSIIVNDFETTYQFDNTNDKWLISSPVNTEADETVISSFLSTLFEAKKSRSFSVSQNEKGSFGLANPFVRVKVVDFNGDADSVLFGDKTSIGEDMYVSKGLQDSMISITPLKLKSDAQKSLFSWRDKKAIHLQKDQVSSLSIKIGSKNYSFKKEGPNWQMTAPLTTLADKGNVDAIINKLINGRINSVQAESAINLRKYDLANPYYKIDLVLAESIKSISFSKLKNNKSFGKDAARSHIFEVDSNFVKIFDKSSYDLRDKDLVNFNVSLIDRINLFFEANILTFNKDTSDTWQIASGESIKSEKIKELVKAVQELRVDRFVAEKPTYLSPFGLAPSKGSLELFMGDSKEVELEFGKVKNGKRYIRKKQSRAVYAVNTEKLENILIKLPDVLVETLPE